MGFLKLHLKGTSGGEVHGTYLIEFNGHYGVAIEASYDEDFARVLSISYEKLKESVRKKVEEYAQKYPELDVIFGEDATKWNDGSSETIILVICPWYMNKEHFLDINEYIENTRYVDLDIEKKSEEKTENIETPEIVETGCKKIYSFDNYEGDKGIIIATSLEEASMIYKEKYPYRTIAQSEEQYYNNGCYILERCKLDNATLVVAAEW